MKKISNLNLVSRVKALVLSGVTLVGFSACGKTDKIEVQNNPAVSPVSLSDGTDVTTNYTTDVNGSAYVTEANGSTSYVETTNTTLKDYVETGVNDVTDYVETTNSGEYVVTDVTDAKTTNGENRTTATTNGTLDRDTDTTKKTTNTTRGTNTTKSTNSTTKTTNSTTKTTKTTTKATTTTTKVTKPPVVRYSIDDICYNVDAFEFYAKKLREDLMNNYMGVSFDGRYTNCSGESKYILLLLNNGCVSNDVIKSVFASYTGDNLYDCIVLVSSFSSFQECTNCNINFASYCCSNRKNAGNYIDAIKNNYKNNSIDSFINDQIVSGHMDPNLYGDSAVMSFACGYDNKGLFNHVDVEDSYVYPFGDSIYDISHGYGYSK
jgi:hypothetical protein